MKRVAKLTSLAGDTLFTTVEGGDLYFIWEGTPDHDDAIHNLGNLPLAAVRWAMEHTMGSYRPGSSASSEYVVRYGNRPGGEHRVVAWDDRITVGCKGFTRAAVRTMLRELGVKA